MSSLLISCGIALASAKTSSGKINGASFSAIIWVISAPTSVALDNKVSTSTLIEFVLLIVILASTKSPSPALISSGSLSTKILIFVPFVTDDNNS